jgi:hypothetical protein
MRPSKRGCGGRECALCMNGQAKLLNREVSGEQGSWEWTGGSLGPVRLFRLVSSLSQSREM